MKKLFLAILILLNSVSFSFAALGANTVWEVRTTGNANNGGGFNGGNATPGTDFSQQDAAEDSGTDLASADGDAVPCVVTSATHNFVDADEGNLIKITEAGDGFTVGYYEIVSTANNAATLDRACGSDGAKTGGDWYLGGASDHPNTIASSVVAGNVIFIADGTYQPVGENAYVLSTAVAGSATGRIMWYGYKTTRTSPAIGDDRPTLDANNVTNSLVVGHDSNVFTSLIITGASGAGISSTKSTTYTNCKIHTNGGDGITVPIYQSIFLILTEINNNSSEGVSVATIGGSAYILDSYFHDNSSHGFTTPVSQGSHFIVGSVFDSNGNAGLNLGNYDSSNYAGEILKGNIAYGNTGEGFSIQRNKGGIFTGFFPTIIYNNVSMSNTYGFRARTYPTDGSSKGLKPFLFDYNAYYNNSTENLSSLFEAGSHDVSTDPSFANAASADFTVGASSPLIGAGLDLSTFTSLTTDFNVNIGIDQSDHVTAGGGGASSYGFSN